MTLITSDTSGARVRCPVCGAANKACGGPTNHTPVDIPAERSSTMGENDERILDDYDVEINGTKTRLRLTPEDAENAEKYEGAKKVSGTRNKARAPESATADAGTGDDSGGSPKSTAKSTAKTK